MTKMLRGPPLTRSSVEADSAYAGMIAGGEQNGLNSRWKGRRAGDRPVTFRADLDRRGRRPAGGPTMAPETVPMAIHNRAFLTRRSLAVEAKSQGASSQ